MKNILKILLMVSFFISVAQVSSAQSMKERLKNARKKQKSTTTEAIKLPSTSQNESIDILDKNQDSSNLIESNSNAVERATKVVTKATKAELDYIAEEYGSDFSFELAEEGAYCENHGSCGLTNEGKQMACINNVCTNVECFYASECTLSNEGCFEFTCQNRSEVYQKYPLSNTASCLGSFCANCIHNKLSFFTDQNFQNLCLECKDDSLCKPGFKCVLHKCVNR